MGERGRNRAVTGFGFPKSEHLSDGVCDAARYRRPPANLLPSDTPMTHGGALTVQPGPLPLRAWLLLLSLLGCGHTDPFTPTPPGTDQPFEIGPPARLTLNPGPDRGAAWLPDGSGILYSTQQLERPDNDVCLALIPPTGGSQRQLSCDLTPIGADTTEAIESPAPTSDGRVAFVAFSSPINAITPRTITISIGSQADPAARTSLHPLPYTLPSGTLHSGASQLRWLSPDTLLYLGERVDYKHTCDTCSEWDTLPTGIDVVSIDVGAPGSTPQRIPGTENASGVSAGASADEIYYTLSGDARVFRRTLSTGAVDVIHDFGAAGMARDVHVVGNRMAAVVGGRVAYGVDPAFGHTQWDSGGVLHVVDIASGSDVTVDGPGLFRRPQISPSGTALVVEVYPVIFSDDPPSAVVDRRGDLYLSGLP